MYRSRGDSRGRSGGFRSSWRGPGSKGARRARDEEPKEEPKGAVVKTITRSDITPGQDSGKTALGISDCEYIASYNWLEGRNAVMLVPGAPPAWTPADSENPPTLQQDSGDYFRDVNAAQWPYFPTEPAVRAIYDCNTAFKSAEIDIFGCGSTLGNLLRFARSEAKGFHFNVERIGKTVFLVRQETSPRELIKDVYGYGHTFPECYTTWDTEVRRSTSHQRLIKYNFGGLTLVVRSESDGYIKSKVKDSHEGGDAPNLMHAKPSSSKETQLSDLISSTSAIKMTPELPMKSSGLELRQTQCKIPQTAILDIKTRSSRAVFDMEEAYRRLWVNQTPNFIIAYHTFGKFSDIQVRDIRAKLEDWEERNQESLLRFHRTLKKLIRVVSDSKENKFEVWYKGDGPLEVRKPGNTGWSALPIKLKAKWAGEEADDEKEEKNEGKEDENDGGDEEEAEDDSYLDF